MNLESGNDILACVLSVFDEVDNLG